MVKAVILCEGCKKKYTLEIDSPSDLFHVKCPKCKIEDDVWIMDTGFKSNGKDIKLGVHSGCSQK